MQIKVYADREKKNHDAARYIVQVAQDAIAARGLFSFALSGGSSPGPVYALLATEPYRGEINWSAVHLFWSDERCVGPEDTESNYHLAWETLLSKQPLKPEQIHRMPADRSDRDRASSDYEAEIKSVLGGEIPRIDLIQLGMGPEGHTASLFPHQPSLHERERLVMPVSVPKPPPDRLTFTPPLLTAARHILYLVSGGDKADALHAVLEGPDDPEEYPSQLIVRQAKGEVVWMLDPAIAQKLSNYTTEG